MLKISIADVIAGAGKSHAARLHAHSLVQQGAWILFLVPATALADEGADHARSLRPEIAVEVIHSQSTAVVGQALMTALKQRPECGRMLFVTWSAFLSLPFFSGKERWTVIVDEIPQVALCDEQIVPDTHQHLTSALELRSKGAAWSRILVKRKGRLRKLASSTDAALKSTLSPLARLLLSPHWMSYIRTSPYHALLNGKGKKFTVHSLLRPRIFHGFERVIMLGANFKNSLFFKVWSAEGVVFEEDEHLTGAVRSRVHTGGEMVTICYGIEVPWSKSVRNKQDGIVWKKLVQAAAERMNGAAFGWIANKDMENPFPGLPAEVLPQVSHGLNSFQHLDNIIFLSARLPSPDHYGFLNWLGLSEEDVRTATYLEPVYQTVLRCSIRDPNNRNPKVVVVPDLNAAEFLRDLLPGSTVEKLSIDLEGVKLKGRRGRPRVHADGTGRVQHHRAQKKAEINRLSAMLRSDTATTTNEDLSAYQRLVFERIHCNDNPIKEGMNNNVPYNAHGSVFAHTVATHPWLIVTGIDTETFIGVLRAESKKSVEQREDRDAFSPGVFDPDFSTEFDRGLDNLVYANGVWLDLEHGHLTHKDFAALFPTLRIVAFNSYNSTKARPRFRIYLPTSRPLTKEEYSLITEQILQVIKDSGYPLPKIDTAKPHLKAHGIDTGKLHAASLFYLPCQPKDPRGRIWKDHKGPGRQPLDVDEWLENAVAIESAFFEPVTVHQDHTSLEGSDQAKVEAAIARWSTYGTAEGKGDAELFILHHNLQAANVAYFDRERLLLGAARSSTSPKDRLRQAYRLLKKRR